MAYIYVLILILCFSYGNSTKSLNNLTGQDFAIQKDSALVTKLKPIFGYRFVIKGDFNGDGKTEILTEHFISGLDKKETNKFYDSLDYDRLVDVIVKKYPISFVTCNNSLIDTLHIDDQIGSFGLSFLKNEGDLDGDGADEISYVVDWADWTSLNGCNIMTYKNKKWEKLYSIPIWEWQLPDLPNISNAYGLFGIEGKVNMANDTLNRKLQEELENFPGFIKKIKTNIIQVRFRNDESEEDTTIVDLRNLKSNNLKMD
jgi:hypothetical protein